MKARHPIFGLSQVKPPGRSKAATMVTLIRL
jgi:hypothetical protein